MALVALLTFGEGGRGVSCQGFQKLFKRNYAENVFVGKNEYFVMLLGRSTRQFFFFVLNGYVIYVY